MAIVRSGKRLPFQSFSSYVNGERLRTMTRSHKRRDSVNVVYKGAVPNEALPQAEKADEFDATYDADTESAGERTSTKSKRIKRSADDVLI